MKRLIVFELSSTSLLKSSPSATPVVDSRQPGLLFAVVVMDTFFELRAAAVVDDVVARSRFISSTGASHTVPGTIRLRHHTQCRDKVSSSEAAILRLQRPGPRLRAIVVGALRRQPKVTLPIRRRERTRVHHRPQKW